MTVVLTIMSIYTIMGETNLLSITANKAHLQKSLGSRITYLSRINRQRKQN